MLDNQKSPCYHVNVCRITRQKCVQNTADAAEVSE